MSQVGREERSNSRNRQPHPHRYPLPNSLESFFWEAGFSLGVERETPQNCRTSSQSDASAENSYLSYPNGEDNALTSLTSLRPARCSSEYRCAEVPGASSTSPGLLRGPCTLAVHEPCPPPDVPAAGPWVCPRPSPRGSSALGHSFSRAFSDTSSSARALSRPSPWLEALWTPGICLPKSYTLEPVQMPT